MTTTQTKHTADVSTMHSKTPWIIEKGMWANEGQIFIESEESGNTHKQHVAKLGYAYDKQGKDQREANAAFIVTACNAHDELVGALEQALPVLLWAAKQSKGNCPMGTYEQTRAALTKAKGGQ